jgi:hypothetical protein
VSLSVAPASVAAGGTVTANWSGIAAPRPRDWIGLYVPGAAAAAYIEWIYVSCSKAPVAPRSAGSCAFTLPASLPPGSYELRLLADDGYAQLTVSNAFTVTF